MNRYAVVITTPDRQDAARIIRKITLDVSAQTGTDAGIAAIRRVNPQGNVGVTIKPARVRS